MGCFTKFFLFVLNFIVFVLGVGVVVLASLILSNSNDFKVLLSDGVFTLPIVLLILGLIVMLIGFFGCFGAMRESPCLLYTYATIVLVLLIAQIAVAIYLLVEKDELRGFVGDSMVKVFDGYGRDDTDLTNSIDASQQTFPLLVGNSNFSLNSICTNRHSSTAQMLRRQQLHGLVFRCY
ncbi:Tetraspanin/Peripherin [Trinorchestia longiramus]|nr:Tetraspanin/Peripherin [Trinorchestia longiramus]